VASRKLAYRPGVDAFAGFVAVTFEADGFHVFEDVRLCGRGEAGDGPAGC